MITATLHTDGGARGNPGPAGIGFVLRIKGRETVFHSAFIGEATNNQAEYTALQEGLRRALQDGVTHLQCFLDSELVVKQLAGEYRVKNEGLQPLYDKVCSLVSEFEKVSFEHIPRERNKEADKLVNRALDKAMKSRRKM